MPRKKKENILQTEIETVSLAELINQSTKFINGKITEEEFDKIGEKINVKTYLPIADKLSAMMIICYDVLNGESEAFEARILNKQKDLFFNILLGMYCNIDVSDKKLTTYVAYDLLYPIFYNYIIQYCGNDYLMLCRMIEDSLNIYNIDKLATSLETLDYKTLDQVNKDNRNFLQELYKKKSFIKDITKMIDTTDNRESFSQTINQMANSLANESLKEE